MKLSEIDSLVDERMRSGSHITQVYIGQLSTKLLHKCLTEAQRTGKRWNEILYRTLKKPEGCATCGAETKWRNYRDGCLRYCSAKCAGADPNVDAKRQRTNLERHGVARPPQELKSIRRKFERTMLKRYGVKHGGESHALRQKAEATIQKRFGAAGRAHPEIQAKSKATMLERYGVEHRMHDRQYFEQQQRKAFKAETFTLDSKTFVLRGYEASAVRWFHERGVSVKHIQTTAAEGVPSYVWCDRSGKKHRYFPDMRVKYKGKWYVIEVKSTFTLGIQNTESAKKSGKFGQVQRKAKAVTEAGDRFALLLVSDKKHVVVIKNFTDKTRHQVIQELQLLHQGKFRQL